MIRLDLDGDAGSAPVATRSHRLDRVKVFADRPTCDLDLMCDPVWEPAVVEGMSLHCKHGTRACTARAQDQAGIPARAYALPSPRRPTDPAQRLREAAQVRKLCLDTRALHVGPCNRRAAAIAPGQAATIEHQARPQRIPDDEQANRREDDGPEIATRSSPGPSNGQRETERDGPGQAEPGPVDDPIPPGVHRERLGQFPDTAQNAA